MLPQSVMNELPGPERYELLLETPRLRTTLARFAVGGRASHHLHCGFLRSMRASDTPILRSAEAAGLSLHACTVVAWGGARWSSGLSNTCQLCQAQYCHCLTTRGFVQDLSIILQIQIQNTFASSLSLISAISISRSLGSEHACSPASNGWGRMSFASSRLSPR
jgi:hypothetical protein